MMPDKPFCKECGGPLTANAPQGLCLDCWSRVAQTLAASRLRTEFVAAGQGELFETLKIFLTGNTATVSYAQLAASLSLTEAALKTAISRMRRRYVVLFRQELASIPGNPFGITNDTDKWRALLKTVAALPTNRGTFLIAPLSALIGEVKDRPAPAESPTDAWTSHCPQCGCEIAAGRTRCLECEIIGLTKPGNAPVVVEAVADPSIGGADEKSMVRGTLWTAGGILVAMFSYPVLTAGSQAGANIIAWGVVLFGAAISLHALRGDGWHPGSEAIAREALAAAKRLEAMGHGPEALAAYKSIAEKFPQTEAGRVALQRLDGLQARLE